MSRSLAIVRYPRRKLSQRRVLPDLISSEERRLNTTSSRVSGLGSGRALLRRSCSWSHFSKATSISTSSTTTELGTTSATCSASPASSVVAATVRRAGSDYDGHSLSLRRFSVALHTLSFCRVGPVSCLPLWQRLLTHGGHTCPTYLCSRSTKRLSALRTGRSVHGQHVMINGIRVSFAETGDALIFTQDRAEHALGLVAPTTHLITKK